MGHRHGFLNGYRSCKCISWPVQTFFLSLGSPTHPLVRSAQVSPSSRKPSLMSLTREDWLVPQGSLFSVQLTLGCDCLRMDCDPWEGRPRAVSIPAVYLAWPSTGLSRGAH